MVSGGEGTGVTEKHGGLIMEKEIPILTGKAAERFLKIAEENYRNRQTVNFSKEYNESQMIIKKSRLL